MKRPPRGAVFEKQKFTKVDFLRGVRERLENEVGSYFRLLDEERQRNSNFPHVGFWGGIRLMMPVIEAISEVYHISQQEFLEQHLNIPTPYLAWDLFRHSLIHNDLMQHGKFQGKEVSWGISIVGQGHIIQNEHIGIDLPTLYEDLKSFLESEIAQNDQTEIEVDVGVTYQAPRQEIVDDFSRL